MDIEEKITELNNNFDALNEEFEDIMDSIYYLDDHFCTGNLLNHTKELQLDLANLIKKLQHNYSILETIHKKLDSNFLFSHKYW